MKKSKKYLQQVKGQKIEKEKNKPYGLESDICTEIEKYNILGIGLIFVLKVL